MKINTFTNYIYIFFTALLRFTIGGWIGWLGLILLALKIFEFQKLNWFFVLIPTIYGFFYCLYMTIDGIMYRNGVKDAGNYATLTQGITAEQSKLLQIQTIISLGAEHTGETIERLSKIPNRLNFNQALFETSIQHYELNKLASFANKGIESEKTIKKWIESGLVIVYPN